MDRKGRIYIVIIIITVAFLMLLQYNKPKELNWFESYVSQHKIPYGTYVLNDLMDKLFEENLQQVSIPPFEFLEKDTTITGTYFFVDKAITFHDTELNTLLDWTAAGNTLFIASSSFESALLDTLHLKTSGLFSSLGEEKMQLHQLVHPKLKTEKAFPFKKDAYINFFKTIDTAKTKVLGVVDNYSEDLVIEKKHFNVIQQAFGKGQIILSTFPKAFTNYFILKDDNHKYTAGLLSYIDASKPVYIDNHYKSGKTFYTSPMHIFLNTKELKWAYYLALIGILFYVVFEGKRKQRAIPIITPLKNQTLIFTRTIADMYFERKKQKPIASLKINQFLEYIRTILHVPTEKQDERFYNNLASRSAQNIDELKKMFSFFNRINKQHEVSDTELKKLNSLIEEFKRKVDGK